MVQRGLSVVGRLQHRFIAVVAVVMMGIALAGLSGCFSRATGELGSALVGPVVPPAGVARASIAVVLPDADDGPAAALRGATRNCRVTGRIRVIDAAAGNQVTDVTRTVAVDDTGRAVLEFSGLPVGAALGELFLTDGHVGGYTAFHGAVDLLTGDNALVVSPKGCGHSSDLAARAVLAVIESAPLLAKARTGLVANLTMAGSAAFASPTALFAADVLNAAFTSGMVFATAPAVLLLTSTEGPTLIASSALYAWRRTPAQLFAGTSVAAQPFVSLTVARQGVAGTALVLGRTESGTLVLARVDIFTGARLAWAGLDGTAFAQPSAVAVLKDGGVVIGGSRNGQPTLACWRGAADAAIDGTGQSGDWAWVTPLPVPAHVRLAQPTVRHLDYDPSGVGRLLVWVDDPETLRWRRFDVRPGDGSPTAATFAGSGFALWGEPGSASCVLAFDGWPATVKYDVLYSTGSAPLGANPGRVSGVSSPCLLDGLSNDATYTAQIVALAANGQELARSGVYVFVPSAGPAPLVTVSYQVSSAAVEISGDPTGPVTLVSEETYGMTLRVRGANPIRVGSVLIDYRAEGSLRLVGQTQNTPQPDGTTLVRVTYDVNTTPTMSQVFTQAQFSYRGRLSQLPAAARQAVNASDRNYRAKMAFLAPRPPAPTPKGIASSTRFMVDNLRFDPVVHLDFTTFLGTLQQFSLELDGSAQMRAYLQTTLRASATLPIATATLVPQVEIPFLVGPVPCTFAYRVDGSWQMKAEGEIVGKLGADLRADFRCGADYLRERGWTGQVLSRFHAEKYWDLDFKAKFSNEANLELSAALKAGGLAGPKLKLRPYLRSTVEYTTDKPCDLTARLQAGLGGAVSMVVEIWQFNLGEWKKDFNVLGPYTIAEYIKCINTLPTWLLNQGPGNGVTGVPEGYTNMVDVVMRTTLATSARVLATDTGFLAGINRYTWWWDDAKKKVTTAYPNEPGEVMTIDLPNERCCIPTGEHVLHVTAWDNCGGSVTADLPFSVAVASQPVRLRHPTTGNPWEEFTYIGTRYPDSYATSTQLPDSWGMDVPVIWGPYTFYHNWPNGKTDGHFTEGRRSGQWTTYDGGYRNDFTYDNAGKCTRWWRTVASNSVVMYDLTPGRTGSAAGVLDFSYNVRNPVVFYGTDWAVRTAHTIDRYEDGSGFYEYDVYLTQIDGPYIYEYPNSRTTGTYRLGKKTGLWTTTGTAVSESGMYDNDLKQGTWVLTNHSTGVTYTITYLDGVEHGPYKREFATGDYVKIVGQYTNGQLSGTWTTYYRDGRDPTVVTY